MLQGAEAALVALVKHFGPSLIAKLPRLWERMSSLLLEHPADQASSKSPPQATADAQVRTHSPLVPATLYFHKYIISLQQKQHRHAIRLLVQGISVRPLLQHAPDLNPDWAAVESAVTMW